MHQMPVLLWHLLPAALDLKDHAAVLLLIIDYHVELAGLLFLWAEPDHGETVHLVFEQGQKAKPVFQKLGERFLCFFVSNPQFK